MTTKHSRNHLEGLLFKTLETPARVSIDDLGCWLLHRAHRPEEYGQDKADAAASAWHLLIQYKQEHGI